MTIAGKTILVTGANRGIGQALVAEALRRGAKQVYAGTRHPLAHCDKRVTPVTLDVTDPAHIRTAAEQIGSLDILINNAGVQPFDDLSDIAPIEQALAVNLFGTYRVISQWGGWGSNPRPADYENSGPAQRRRYLHGCHSTVPPMALIALTGKSPPVSGRAVADPGLVR